jgi:hypothetical protein
MTIQSRFKSSIKRGTGEAYLIMKEFPSMDFSKFITWAALKNLSYDNQSEGSRGKYIYELFKISKNKEKIRAAILKGLATESEDTWALVQLFDLAGFLAKDGDLQARKAIYDRFYKKTIQGSESAGQETIIELDGLEGLKYIAEATGKELLKDPDEWTDGSLVSYFQSKIPDIDVLKELKKASRTNPYIKVYTKAISVSNKPEIKKNETRKVIEIVNDRIAKNSKYPIWASEVEKLSKEEKKKLATDFLNSNNKLTQETYLRVFSKVKYPFDIKTIFEIAKEPISTKNRRVEFAIFALSFFTAPELRRFALKQIKTSSRPAYYTNLLASNYKNGDGKMLKSLVDKTSNESKIHNLAISFVEIYKANKTRDCKFPLLALYDKLNCGIHREDIIRIMIENQVLTEKIKLEIPYDSDSDIREIALK